MPTPPKSPTMNKTISIILALIIAAFAAEARVPSLNFRGTDSYNDFEFDKTTPVRFQNEAEGVGAQIFEFGVSADGSTLWRADLLSDADTLSVTIEPPCEDFAVEYSRQAVRIHASRGGSDIMSTMISEGISIDRHPNYLRITVYPDTILISAGNKELRHVGGIAACGFYPEALLSTDRKATLCRSLIGYEPLPDIYMSQYSNIDDIYRALADCNDPKAGIWEYFDDSIDTEYARRGGNYTIALLPDGNNGYTILYIEGATANAKAWHTGMIKGYLTPTNFVNNYNMQWIDSQGRALSDGLNATFDSYTSSSSDSGSNASHNSDYNSVGNTFLTLDFPYQRTRFRFTRPLTTF